MIMLLCSITCICVGLGAASLFLPPLSAMKYHFKSNPVIYMFWQFSSYCKEKVTTLWYYPFSITWVWSKCSNSERMSCSQYSVLFKNSFFRFSKMHLFSN